MHWVQNRQNRRNKSTVPHSGTARIALDSLTPILNTMSLPQLQIRKIEKGLTDFTANVANKTRPTALNESLEVTSP